MENRAYISEQDLIDLIDGIFKQTSVIMGDGKDQYDSLNIAWFAKKLRIVPSKDYLEALRGKFIKEQNTMDAKMAALNRSFGLCEITSDMHLQNADIDYTEMDARFTCLLQTHKLPFLENLLIRTNLSLIGGKFPILIEHKDANGAVISSVMRYGNVVVSRPQVQEVDPESEVGESATVIFTVSLLLFEDLPVYSDYLLELSTDGDSYVKVPFVSFNPAFDTVQKALPNTNLAETGTLATTGGMTFSFSVYNRKNELGAIIERILFKHQLYGSTEAEQGNNIGYYLRLTSPNNIVYTYLCIVLSASSEIPNTLTPTQTSVILKPIAIIDDQED